MDEIIKELKKAVRELTGGGDIWGGRSAEVNARVGKLMGQTITSESPKGEYDRCQALARKVTQ